MTNEYPICVVGLSQVGVAVVHRLQALRVPVTALTTAAEHARMHREFTKLGVQLLEVSQAWETEIDALPLQNAGCLVLAGDDEAHNVDACLIVRRHYPDLPISVRVSDVTLVRFLRMSVPHVDVYSMGSTTAPVAAELALQLMTTPREWPKNQRLTHTRAPARPITLALRWIVFACALSAVLAVAAAPHLTGLSFTRAGLWLVEHSLGVGDLAHTAALRWFAIVARLLGILLPAALIGMAVNMLITQRLSSLALSNPVRLRDHIVVFGAGNVGARAAEWLHKRKLKVVVVEHNAQLRNVQSLQSQGIPVIIGDATVPATLDLAAAWRASVALALTNSDAVNLHIALQLADKKVGVPTALRLLSPELSAHAAQLSNMTTISPVAETASHVCRTVERMRSERQKVKTDSAPDVVRTTGRFAGREFDEMGPPGSTPFPPTRIQS